MATPTNLPAAATVGQVYTAANVNDLRGAFRVLQVKSMSLTTQLQATAAYADTGLTLAITPQSSTSQIMVFVNMALYMNNTGANANVLVLRGASTIWSAPNLFTANSGAAGAIQSINYLDSPATTSATTYKVQFKNDGSNLLFLNINGNNRSSLTLMEISA
jgi:hypothetical protein